MLLVVQTALELGFLYAPVALALFLSFRVLDIADLTTDDLHDYQNWYQQITALYPELF